MELFLAFAMAALAGFMNNYSGGGRFVLFPALFLLGNTLTVAEFAGVSKMVSIPVLVGNLRNIKSRIYLSLFKFIPVLIVGMALAAVSTLFFLSLDEFYQKVLLVIFLLSGFLTSVFAKKRLSKCYSTPNGSKFFLFYCLSGVYEGGLGAGNGSILTFLLKKYRLKNTSDAIQIARVLSIGLALGSLSVFILAGSVDWILAFPMAACVMVGDIVGDFSKKHSLVPKKIGRYGDLVGLAASGWSAYLILAAV